MIIALAALLGLYIPARRRVLRSLVERAERAERERYLLAEQARFDLGGLAAERLTQRIGQGVGRVGGDDERLQTAGGGDGSSRRRGGRLTDAALTGE